MEIQYTATADCSQVHKSRDDPQVSCGERGVWAGPGRGPYRRPGRTRVPHVRSPAYQLQKLIPFYVPYLVFLSHSCSLCYPNHDFSTNWEWMWDDFLIEIFVSFWIKAENLIVMFWVFNDSGGVKSRIKWFLKKIYRPSFTFRAFGSFAILLSTQEKFCMHGFV